MQLFSNHAMQFPGCWGHWCRFGSQKAQYKWTEQIIDFASSPQAAWPAGVNGAGAVVGLSPPIMQHEQNDVRQKRRFVICVAEQKESDMNSILTSPVHHRHTLHQFG